MQSSQAPAKLQEAFAAAGSRNAIPKVKVNPGQASYDSGFPPETMQPLVSGGVPPDGKDFNGLLYAMSAFQVWQSAGGGLPWDGTFSGLIGGYPLGSLLQSSDLAALWLSGQENNGDNPDAGAGVNWQPVRPGGYKTVALSNANITLTPLQASNRVIDFTGALAGNVVVTFPAWQGYRWVVLTDDLTFGGFSLTIKGAGGGGIIMIPGLTTPVYVDDAGTLQPEQLIATEPLPGIASVATQAQTNAITSDQTIVTPKKLGFGFSAVFGVNGGIRLPQWLGGITINWGQSTVPVVEGAVSLPFAIPFTTAVYAAVPTAINNTFATDDDVWAQWNQSATTLSVLYAMIQWDGQPSNKADGWSFIAVGK